MPLSPAEQLLRLNQRDAKRQQTIDKALEARDRGATLREAAAAAGIHVSTLCRWQGQDEWLRRCLQVYGGEARFLKRLRRMGRPPPLPWHRSCPACGAEALVRTAYFGRKFWRCSTWPACGWASWQPRHPEDCPACAHPRYLSRSGKTVYCPGCGRCYGERRADENADVAG